LVDTNFLANSNETIELVFEQVTLPISYTAKMQLRRKPDDETYYDFTLSESSGVFTATSQNVFSQGVYMYDLRIKDNSDNTYQTLFKGIVDIL